MAKHGELTVYELDLGTQEVDPLADRSDDEFVEDGSLHWTPEKVKDVII
jgi:hypothetical protein